MASKIKPKVLKKFFTVVSFKTDRVFLPETFSIKYEEPL